MREQRPARFGNYDIIESINTGGMGEVYLARQRSAFGRLVALKIIRSDLVYDNTARARFLREAEVSAHLKHEHILPLFEFGEDQGRLFLVTPYIEGGTLEARLRNGPLPLPLHEVRQLFVPLGQAVAYIHRRGVVHRDLKPSNILLDKQDGQVYVRLIDFGIATVQGSQASPPLTTSSSEVVGTFVYMAPERMDGVAAPSNDIFSLGIILHQMLTGRLPMGEQIDDMPEPLREVVARSIALRPEDRYATAEEVVREFERAYQLINSPTRPSSVRLSPLDHSLDSRFAPGDQDVREHPQPEEIILESTGRSPVLPPETDQPASLYALGPGDHSAQTVSFLSTGQQQGRSSLLQPSSRLAPLMPALEPPAQAPLARPRRRRSLIPLLSALTAVVLLAIAFLAYYGYQTVTTTAVTVSFGPKVVPLSNSYTIIATPAVQSVDVTNSTIPLHGATSNKQSQATGPATGQVNCILGFIGCQTGVSQADVDNLANQERPGLRASLTQALNQQVATAGGTKVGDITFNETVSPNPTVGTQSKTVTVTLAEQATVVYYVNADVQSVVRQKLQNQVQHLGANYVLISSTEEFGQAALIKIDAASGKVYLKIAAGGDAVYQFPASQLHAIQNALKGKTVKQAQTYLQNQPGIDPSSISISFTEGRSATLPGDIQHITVVHTNVSNYPLIQLDATPGATVTPSQTPANVTPTTTQNP